MAKPKSRPIFDESDFPVSVARLAIMQGLGVEIEELKGKPIIAVANSHTEMNPGHMHLRGLAERVKEGVHAAGGIPFEFNVPAPCDGFTEGNEGMRLVLPQRELIADMVETHTRSMLFDGMVLVASCDKISIDIPGRLLEVKLSEGDIASRLEERRPVEREVPPGFMRRYVRQVSSAAKGAVLS